MTAGGGCSASLVMNSTTVKCRNKKSRAIFPFFSGITFDFGFLPVDGTTALILKGTSLLLQRGQSISKVPPRDGILSADSAKDKEAHPLYLCNNKQLLLLLVADSQKRKNWNEFATYRTLVHRSHGDCGVLLLLLCRGQQQQQEPKELQGGPPGGGMRGEDLNRIEVIIQNLHDKKRHLIVGISQVR